MFATEFSIFFFLGNEPLNVQTLYPPNSRHCQVILHIAHVNIGPMHIAAVFQAKIEIFTLYFESKKYRKFSCYLCQSSKSAWPMDWIGQWITFFQRWFNVSITMSTNLKNLNKLNKTKKNETKSIKWDVELTVCAKMRLSSGVHASIWTVSSEVRLKMMANATTIITKIINTTYQKSIQNRSIGFRALDWDFPERFVHIVTIQFQKVFSG